MKRKERDMLFKSWPRREAAGATPDVSSTLSRGGRAALDAGLRVADADGLLGTGCACTWL